MHCPDYIEPLKDRSELEIVKRVFQSFRKMKENQKNVSDCYLPSMLWQEALAEGYSYLTSSLKTNDLSKFHFFLTNFGSWKTFHGIEHATLIRDNTKSLIRRRYLKNVIFYNQLKI